MQLVALALPRRLRGPHRPHPGRGHIDGPELAGPAWGHGERCYAAGDSLLVHGTLHTGGQRFHNGSVVTITVVTADGVTAVDQHGVSIRLPQEFITGHRPDGSPNCSHAWARTVDGVQGGTWPQVHLLGTAALERFTGYTGQSRSRHATHTWNVTRLPEIDHGGVVADQRTAERKVLDALRRQPDTGFAIHDAPTHRDGGSFLLAAVAAELGEGSQPDRHPAFHQCGRWRRRAWSQPDRPLHHRHPQAKPKSPAANRPSRNSGPSSTSASKVGELVVDVPFTPAHH